MKKKALSLALALVMCLGLSVPAFAAEVKAGDTSITDSKGITYSLSNPIIGIDSDQTYLLPIGTTITPVIPEGYTYTDIHCAYKNSADQGFYFFYNLNTDDMFGSSCGFLEEGKNFVVPETRSSLESRHFVGEISDDYDPDFESGGLYFKGVEAEGLASGEKYVAIQAGGTEGKDASGNVFKLSQPVASVTTSKAGFPVHQIPEGTVISLYNSDGSLADSIFMEEYVDEESEAAWPGENPSTFQTASENFVSLRTGADTYLFVQVVKNTSAPATVPAAPTNDSLTCNGTAQDPTVYKIGDSNYFKIRDLAAILNGTEKQFSVGYDSALKSVTVTTGEGYTKLDTDLTGAAAGNQTATVSNDAIYVNGEKIDAEVYKIDGGNYFKLRDLGKALDFYVGWSRESGMYIETDKPYSE